MTLFDMAHGNAELGDDQWLHAVVGGSGAAAEERDPTAMAGGVSRIVRDMLNHHGLRVRGRECCTSSRVGARVLMKCTTSTVV
jgi:hypothetical protein